MDGGGRASVKIARILHKMRFQQHDLIKWIHRVKWEWMDLLFIEDNRVFDPCYLFAAYENTKTLTVNSSSRDEKWRHESEERKEKKKCFLFVDCQSRSRGSSSATFFAVRSRANRHKSASAAGNVFWNDFDTFLHGL